MLTNAATGVHSLTARAVDNAGGAASSPITVVSVNPTTTKTVNPTADAYVKDGSGASANYGTATTLQVRTSATSGNNHDSYFKYDISTTGTIGVAKLRVYTALSATGSMNTFVYRVANTTWIESGSTGIKWSNKPPLGTAIGSSLNINTNSYRWYEFDVTSYIQSEKAAGRNVVTLALHNTPNLPHSLMVNSREATIGRPELFVTPAASNTPPTVDITSPASDSQHPSGGSTLLTAAASDPGGSVSKVEFYAGKTLTGSATSAPFEFTWIPAKPGLYSVTAKAIDSANAVTVSSPVSIEVYNSGGTPTGTLINPVEDTYVTSNTGTGYGSSTPLIASSFMNYETGTSTYRHAYLKFDLTSVEADASAKLRVYAATFNWGINPLFVDQVADSNWSESGTFWYNRPALGNFIRNLHVSGRAYQWVRSRRDQLRSGREGGGTTHRKSWTSRGRP